MTRTFAPLRLLAAVAACAGLCTIGARAQVAVNPGALESLSSTPAPAPAPARPAEKHPARPAAHRPAAKPAPHTATQATPPKPPPQPPQPPVALAPAPPPVASIVPVPLPPPAHPLPAPPVPLAADAAGEATPIPGGVRVTFGPGKAELNPATAEAIRTLGQSIAADPAESVNVLAYAAGSPDDPSTPRRVSLSRALAARAVLLGEGIASTRIYPRALGSTPSAGPEDRVDLVVAGAAPPAAPARSGTQ